MNEEIVYASLDSVAETLKTGDIVFFQGTAADSVLIRNITGGTWSHCAMIIRGNDIDCNEHLLLLLESSVWAGKDIIVSSNENERKAGVMLVEFLSRMKEYGDSGNYSKIGIKRFNSDRVGEINFTQLKEFVDNQYIRQSGYPAEYMVAAEHFIARELQTDQFRKKTILNIKKNMASESIRNLSDSDLEQVINMTIESASEDFDSSVHDKNNHDHSVTSHYFCSELVADALMHMGVLELKNAASFSPNDLAADFADLMNGCYADFVYLPGDLGQGNNVD